MRTYRLGKASAITDSRTLRLGAYLEPAFPHPPAVINYGKNVTDWPMYLNDQYGDCTCAAAAHMIQDWTAAVKQPVTPTNDSVLEFYKHFTIPGPENGCAMLSVLKYWRSGGLGGDKIGAFVQLEVRNTVECKDSVNLFGSTYVGLQLPRFATRGPDLSKVPWVLPSQGPVGDGAPDPNGGHCVAAVGYDARNLYVVTWGAIKAMSWQFYEAYCDESYAVLSQDFLSADKAPNGFDIAQLRQDLDEIGKIPAHRATVR